MNRLIRIALTFLLVMTSGVIQAEIVIYPVPQGIYYARHNDDYTVKVRQVGEKDWVDLYEYNCSRPLTAVVRDCKQAMFRILPPTHRHRGYIPHPFHVVRAVLFRHKYSPV